MREASELRAHYETEYLAKPGVAERLGQARLPLFRTYLPRLECATAGRRLLDLGCGRGHFLALAAARGWHGTGLELQRGAAEVGEGRGVRIVEGGDEILEAMPAAFDVATLWNVLDQMPCLAATLPRIRRALVEGGVLFARVPNLRFHLALHRTWRRLRLPGRSPALFHDLAFSPAALRVLLERSGFHDVRVENSRLTDIRPLPVRWLLEGGSGLLARLSGGHCLVAPSLVVTAVRGGREAP